MDYVVNEFSRCFKLLADDITEDQFEVFVQQELEFYESSLANQEVLAQWLQLNTLQSYHPLHEKHKHLRSIKFADFQRFCRDYCKQVRIKALIQGNVTADRALNTMRNLLNDLNCGRIEDVSHSFFLYKWN